MLRFIALVTIGTTVCNYQYTKINKFKVNKMFIVHITTEKYSFIECEDVLQKK
jgi:hypothetical protein